MDFNFSNKKEICKKRGNSWSEMLLNSAVTNEFGESVIKELVI